MDTPSTGSLDREVALTRMGGDPELLKEIAQLFLENYQEWMRDLRLATERGDALMVERTAHGLKGSVANFGARHAVEASMNLESLGRNRDLAGATESLAALELALETLRGDLESL
jgi:two-component system sensor histidine kinase/response regulator